MKHPNGLPAVVTEMCQVEPRDGGLVIRLRGPYKTPAVDYWPTTGTCRQVGGEFPTHRHAGPKFAARLAFYGSEEKARREKAR